MYMHAWNVLNVVSFNTNVLYALVSYTSYGIHEYWTCGLWLLTSTDGGVGCIWGSSLAGSYRCNQAGNGEGKKAGLVSMKWRRLYKRCNAHTSKANTFKSIVACCWNWRDLMNNIFCLHNTTNFFMLKYPPTHIEMHRGWTPFQSNVSPPSQASLSDWYLKLMSNNKLSQHVHRSYTLSATYTATLDLRLGLGCIAGNLGCNLGTATCPKPVT